MANDQETNLWTVWPGRHEATTETYDFAQSTTSIQWDEVHDLRGMTRNEVRDLLARSYPGDPANTHALFALLAFRDQIKLGHFIVMPMRRADHGIPQFALGVVLGEYAYDATRSGGCHHRAVTWLYKSLPRSILVPLGLKTAIESRGTVQPIYAEQAVEHVLRACWNYTTSSQAPAH